MAWYDNPQTVAALNDIFKEILHPVIIDQLNRECLIWGIMQQNSDALVGRRWEVPVEVGRNEGIGYVQDNRELPKAGRQSFDRTELYPKAMFGRMLVTGHAMEQTGSDYGALAQALEIESRGLVRDFKYEFGRVFWGNGRGIFANCIAATNHAHAFTGNVTVQDSWGIVSNDNRPNRLFRPGMEMACINNAGAAAIALFVINSVTAPNIINITTRAGNVGDGANALALVRSNVDAVADIDDTGYGVLSAVGTQRESFGLQNIANNDWYMGIDGSAAGFDWWASYTRDMLGAVITEEHIMEALDEQDILSGSQPSTYITSHAIQRQLAAALVADRRFVNEMTYKGGWKAVEIAGYPVLKDRHAPIDMLFGLDLPDLTVKQTRPPFWVDDDGAILHRRENVYSFQATMGYFHNLACFDRKHHQRLYNAAI